MYFASSFDAHREAEVRVATQAVVGERVEGVFRVVAEPLIVKAANACVRARDDGRAFAG